MKGLLSWLFYSVVVVQSIISISGHAIIVDAIYHLSLYCTSISLRLSDVWNVPFVTVFGTLNFGCLKGDYSSKVSSNLVCRR